MLTDGWREEGRNKVGMGWVGLSSDAVGRHDDDGGGVVVLQKGSKETKHE